MFSAAIARKKDIKSTIVPIQLDKLRPTEIAYWAKHYGAI